VIRRALFAAIFLGALTPAARAHPIHSSYAEADYRPDSGQLEIALRVFTDDAEAALSARAGKKISVTAAPAAEVDRLLLAVVQSAFRVKSNTGAVQPLTWIGRELKDGDQHLWIFLTCPLPGGAAGARLSDRVLHETFSDQLNSVRVRDHSATPARQTTLLFLNDGEQTVRFEK
jgi:hypothetical protein